jgi:hypothetical protein
MTNRLLKKASCRLLKKIQRRGVRKIDERWGVHRQYVDARRLERNEAYGSFSAA